MTKQKVLNRTTISKTRSKLPVKVKKLKAKKSISRQPKEGLATLPFDKIYANEEQARKIFDESKLRELAASIRQQGLMNPIVVRPDGEGRYMIVAGERRYRACKLLELTEIQVLIKNLDNESVTYQMIIENLQRQDITPLEEARAFKKAMDDFGLASFQLAHKLGITQPHRITERLQLLKLKPDYQEYLAKGLLSPTQAFYLAKTPFEYQDSFWQMIRSGRADNNSLAVIAQSFVDAANQTEMFAECKVSAEEMRAINTLENNIDKMFGIVSKFFNKDGEVDILKKIDPSRAGSVADKIKMICRSMQSAEKLLREPAAQQQVMAEVRVA
jgi:ParB family chromosome partitioning protein